MLKNEDLDAIFSKFVRGSNKGTPLFKAVQAGDLAEIKRLQAEDASIIPTRCDISPIFTVLHLAAAMGRPEVAQYLLEQGESLFCPDISGLFPIHYAVYNAHYSVVDILFKADRRALFLKGVMNFTPSKLAEMLANQEMLGYLLKKAEEGLLSLNASRKLRFHPTKGLWTFAQYLAMNDDFVLLKLHAGKKGSGIFFEKNRDIMRPNLLFYSVEHNNLAMTKYLIEAGLDINAKNTDRQTPLQFAIYRGKKVSSEIKGLVDRTQKKLSQISDKEQGFHRGRRDLPGEAKGELCYGQAIEGCKEMNAKGVSIPPILDESRATVSSAVSRQTVPPVENMVLLLGLVLYKFGMLKGKMHMPNAAVLPKKLASEEMMNRAEKNLQEGKAQYKLS